MKKTKKQIAKKKIQKKTKENNKEKNTKNNPKIVKIYLCPNCRSAKVKRIFTIKNLFGLQPKWKCQKCGYESPIFPLIAVDINKLNKNKIQIKSLV
ncbi:MAG: hypothetical protein Q7S33_01275 [Nanoarchaeota archaeon]|nr:hypothetical protein [Nanoarchaeota archaeon]